MVIFLKVESGLDINVKSQDNADGELMPPLEQVISKR